MLYLYLRCILYKINYTLQHFCNASIIISIRTSHFILNLKKVTSQYFNIQRFPVRAVIGRTGIVIFSMEIFTTSSNTTVPHYRCYRYHSKILIFVGVNFSPNFRLHSRITLVAILGLTPYLSIHLCKMPHRSESTKRPAELAAEKFFKCKKV